MPVMGHSFAEADGKPQRVVPEHVSLGLAVDVERKDGTRSLVVPVHQAAPTTLDFADFVARYDELVAGARDNTLSPDAYRARTSRSPTRAASAPSRRVPRLMPGPGHDRRHRRDRLPARPRRRRPGAAAELGVSKVMTMTSTYDHRVIQGAESGAFLRRIDELLQGEDGFYERGLRSARPRSAPAEAPAADAPASRSRRRGAPAAAPVPTRDAAPGGAGRHLARQGAPHARPPGRATRPARLRAGRRPGARARDRRPDRRSSWSRSRRTSCASRCRARRSPTRCRTCGRPTAARSPTRSSTSPTTSSACGCASDRVGHATASRCRRRRSSALLERLTEVEALETYLHKAFLGQEAVLDRGPRRARADARRDDRAGRPTPARARSCIGMAHRGRLNVLAHTVGRPYEAILAEFEGEQDIDVDTARPRGRHRRREVPPRRRRAPTRRGAGKQRDRHAVAEPEPPRVRGPGRRGPRPRRPDRAARRASIAHDPTRGRCRC